MKGICKHHWIIPTSSAVEVKAQCQFCGAEKTMNNLAPYYPEPKREVGNHYYVKNNHQLTEGTAGW